MVTEITYLVAPVVNAIELPIMAFPAPEDAHQFCWDLGLRGARPLPDQPGEWEPITDRSIPVTRYLYAFQDGEYVSLPWALEMEGKRLWQAVPALFGKERAPLAPITVALFRDGYYDSGNGELYCIEIRTVPVGAPVVAWDFD